MHRSMQLFSRFIKDQGLSFSQINALFQIQMQGDCSVSDISDHLGITKAATSQMLDRLVEQDFIKRAEDPNDRRNKLITLTSSGKVLVQQAIYARDEWLGEIEASLSPQEKELVIQALNLLTEKASLLGE